MRSKLIRILYDIRYDMDCIGIEISDVEKETENLSISDIIDLILEQVE